VAIDLRRARLVERAFIRRFVATPEVEVEGEVGGEVRGRLPRAGERRRYQAVLGEALPGGIAVAG